MSSETKSREAGSEVTIYETWASDSETDNSIEPQSTQNKDIDTEVVIHEASLSAFLDPATRINEPIKERIARVRKEIKEIQKLGHESESQQLYKELFDALQPNASPQKIQNTELPLSANQTESKMPVEHKSFSSEQFGIIEARIAKLETVLGRSARSPSGSICVFDRLKSLDRIITLLATDPDRLKAQLTAVSDMVQETKDRSSEETYQINWIYRRLKSLENTLELVPTVASRLKTLHNIHRDALSFSTNMEELQKVMTSMESDNRAWRDILNKLESQVDKTVHVTEN